MREIQTLDKFLLKNEFETARAVYEAARGQGFGPVQAAALVYRHGFLDGKELQRGKTSQAYQKLNELRAEMCPEQSPPEATIEEGSDTNA